MAGAEEPNGITGTKQEEEKREMKAGVIQQLPVSNLKGGKNASRGKTFLTQHGLEAFESGVPLETSASHQSSRLLEKQKQNASVQDELDRKRREVCRTCASFLPHAASHVFALIPSEAENTARCTPI